MLRSLLLAVALLPSPALSAQGNAPDAALNSREAPREIEPDEAKPAPQLVRLDQSLMKARNDKGDGRLDEKGYQEFAIKFRADLSEAMSRVKPTPPNMALHARILSRLGDSERALAALGAAIKQDPDSPALRVAASQVHYDQKDYPAALAEANAALEIDPTNKEAQALKHFSEGRVGPGGGASSPASDRAIPEGVSDGAVAVTERFRAPRAEDSPKVQALVPRIRDARDSGDLRTAMSLTQELMRTEPTSEFTQEIYRIVSKDYAHWQRVQETVGDINNAKAALKAGRDDEALEWTHRAIQTDPDPKVVEFAGQVQKIVDDDRAGAASRSRTRKTPASNGGIPLAPMVSIFGLGAAGYAVAKSRKTVESEDGFNEYSFPPTGEGQRFVAGAVLAGMAGAALYLAGAYAITAGPPLVTRLMAGPGQQAMRLAQSEVGAINPAQAQAIANTAAAGSTRLLPGFTAAESQVIYEAQQILDSPQFRELLEAQKAGRPIAVTIGGRIIQYEPDMPAAGLTNFQKNGFVIGREAFSSGMELKRTVLHELYRLATSQWANGVTGSLASQEAKAAQEFSDKAVVALPK